MNGGREDVRRKSIGSKENDAVREVVKGGKGKKTAIERRDKNQTEDVD